MRKDVLARRVAEMAKSNLHIATVEMVRIGGMGAAPLARGFTPAPRPN
jgi:hypothetical protein